MSDECTHADAIRDVAAGKTRIVPKAIPDDADAEPLPPMPQELTPREVEVLRLVARGQSTREVARQLGITPKTAGTHIEHIDVA